MSVFRKNPQLLCVLDIIRTMRMIKVSLVRRLFFMKLIYPAIFTPYYDEGGYDVMIPDLPDCSAAGDTLEEAIEDAVNQASGAILSIMEKGGEVPPASEYTDIQVDDPDDFVSLIVLDMGAYSDAHAQKSVRKNITIPAWLNAYGEAHHVNFSKVLQDALLHMTQKKKDRNNTQKFL